MHPGGRATRVVLAVLVLGACASSDDDASADASSTGASDPTTPGTTTAPVATTIATTTTTTTAPPTTTAAPATAAPSTATRRDTTVDEFVDLAAGALIELTQLPAGWVEVPDEPDGEDDGIGDAFGDEVDACLGREGRRSADELDGREATTGSFEGPGGARPTVEQEIRVADEEQMAISVMDDVGADGADDCLASTLQAFLDAEFRADIEQDGIALGEITVARVDVDAPADERVAYRVGIPLTLDGETFVQYLEVLYQRQGRALSQLQFGSFGVPFDAALYAELADTVDARLRAIGRPAVSQ